MGANSLERRGRMNKYTPLALLEALKCAPRQAKPQAPLSQTEYGVQCMWRVPPAQEGSACTHIRCLPPSCAGQAHRAVLPLGSAAGRAP